MSAKGANQRKKCSGNSPVAASPAGSDMLGNQGLTISRQAIIPIKKKPTSPNAVYSVSNVNGLKRIYEMCLRSPSRTTMIKEIANPQSTNCETTFLTTILLGSKLPAIEGIQNRVVRTSEMISPMMSGTHGTVAVFGDCPASSLVFT